MTNGKSKRIFISAKTRDELISKLREIHEQENKRIPFQEKEWVVEDYLDYWMREVQSKRVRETTMRTYSVLIERHIKPAMGGHKLRDLSVHDVRCALGILEEQGCSAKTRLECLRVLSACLNNAMREEITQRNVVQLVAKPKYIPKKTVIWTAEQAGIFLQSAKDHPQFIAFLLLLTYGMRRGEVLGLRYCDIDFDNGLIYVRQQIDRINGRIMARDVKTENSRRTLPLIPAIRTELLNHAERNCTIIPPFDLNPDMSTEGTIIVGKTGRALEPKSLVRSFDILAMRAGLPRIKVHAMRHTAATVLKDLGVPVKDAQLILGHSNIITTLNIYQHGTPDTHRTAISAVGERLFGGLTGQPKCLPA